MVMDFHICEYIKKHLILHFQFNYIDVYISNMFTVQRDPVDKNFENCWPKLLWTLWTL